MVDEITDSAPGSEESTDENKVTFDEKQQEVFNREMGKSKWELRRKEQELENLRKELEGLKAGKEQEQRPVVSAEPDPLDDDFEEKLRERERQVEAAARFDERQKWEAEQRQRAEQEAQQKVIQTQQEKVAEYTKRAGELGIKPEELQEAGNMDEQAGIAPDVVDLILSDEKGPMITKALAQDVNKLIEFSRLTPIQQAIEVNKIKSTVTPQSSAPDPFDVPKGSGVTTQKGPKGATYE